MLLWEKLRSGAAVLAGVALLLGAGVGLVSRGVAADDKPGVKAPVPEKKAEPKDEDLIQGSWQAVAAESDGKMAPDEAVKAVVLRFKGSEATFPGDKVLTFALDPKAKPKGLTLTSTAGPQKGVKVESAIYELTGDDLKVCVDWGRDGKPGTRPTDFTTAPRDGRISLTLKRVKEEPKKEEGKQPDEAKKDEPAWKAEFRKAYGLKDGELVTRIAPPYPDCRTEFFRDRIWRRDGRNPAEFELEGELNNFTVFNWKDGTSTAGWQTGCEPNEGVSLGFVLDTVLGISKSRIEVNGVSLNDKVTGDFVVRVGADREKMAAQLETILRTDVGLPVKFIFKEVEEEVFVVSGKYAAKPLEDRKADEIEVYAVRLIDRNVGGGGSGDFQGMIDAIERHTGRPILLDKIDGLPKAVRWHFNFSDPRNKQIEAQERDAATLLDNVAAQTGLTVKEEKRKVRKLVVAHVPGDAPPPVAKRPADPPEPADPEPEVVKDFDPVTAATYSRDGKRFALVLRATKEVKVYDTATWKVMHTLDGLKDLSFAVQFSADGGTLYVAEMSGAIRTWDVKTGKASDTLDTKAGRCFGLVLSPDGKRLASGHDDRDAGTSSIQQWDTATGKVVRAVACDVPLLPNTLTFTPDGKGVAGGCHASHKKVPDADGFHGVIEWDAATGKERKRYDTPRVSGGAIPIAHAVRFTNDGKKLILGGGEAVPVPGQRGATNLYGYLWVIDRESGEVEKTLLANRDDYIRSLAVSPDGKRLYVPAGAVSARGLPRNLNPNDVRRVYEFQCWNTETWEVEWAATSPDNPSDNKVTASPDGKRVGVGGANGFRLHDTGTGEVKGAIVERRAK